MDAGVESGRKEVSLPSLVDLRPAVSPVYNQLTLPSCTSVAVVSLLEHLELRGTGKYTPLSALYLYNHTRAWQGNLGKRPDGAWGREVLNALDVWGCATEYEFPYDPKGWGAMPTALWNVKPYQRKIERVPLKSREAMLNSLNAGYGFIMPIAVYDHIYQYYHSRVANTGMSSIAEHGERIVGNHTVFVCGYKFDDEVGAGGGRWLCKNSWGKEWGYDGYFWLPFSSVPEWSYSDSYSARMVGQ